MTGYQSHLEEIATQTHIQTLTQTHIRTLTGTHRDTHTDTHTDTHMHVLLYGVQRFQKYFNKRESAFPAAKVNYS